MGKRELVWLRQECNMNLDLILQSWETCWETTDGSDRNGEHWSNLRWGLTWIDQILPGAGPYKFLFKKIAKVVTNPSWRRNPLTYTYSNLQKRWKSRILLQEWQIIYFFLGSYRWVTSDFRNLRPLVVTRVNPQLYMMVTNRRCVPAS